MVVVLEDMTELEENLKNVAVDSLEPLAEQLIVS